MSQMMWRWRIEEHLTLNSAGTTQYERSSWRRYGRAGGQRWRGNWGITANREWGGQSLIGCVKKRVSVWRLGQEGRSGHVHIKTFRGDIKWILYKETNILLSGWLLREEWKEQSFSSGPCRTSCRLQLITPSISLLVPSPWLHQSCAGGTARWNQI